MLGVAPPRDFDAAHSMSAEPELLSVMAALFAEALEDATARGVLHGYRSTEERLVAPRGRIDMNEQLRQPAIISPIACRYDDYTADVFANRALVAALDRLHRVPLLEPQLRVRLGRLAPRFEDVAHTNVDPSAIDRWRPNRLDQHYERAMRIAALVLRNLSFSQRVGDHRNLSFTVNMNDLFQEYVTSRLRRHLRGHIEVIGEPAVPLTESSTHLRMEPDLVFRRPQGAVYVGDVKYKLSNERARISDYYQLLAYTTAMDLPEGVLIYAQAPDGDPELSSPQLVHTSRIRHTDKLVHVYRLPMEVPAAELEDGIEQLATWIRGRAVPDARREAA
jgi:5-methylcytosine-specific restriction enzyme subunit McrC